MKKKWLYAAWGVLYSVCAVGGFIREQEGAKGTLLTVLSAIFFVPPVLLLIRADREQDRDTLALLRNLSYGSLGLTLLALVLNLVFATGSEKVGAVLHGVLVIVSSPMICSGYWALSLFLWACLLTAARKLLRKH